jgi:hypothetical protein
VTTIAPSSKAISPHEGICTINRELAILSARAAYLVMFDPRKLHPCAAEAALDSKDSRYRFEKAAGPHFAQLCQDHSGIV